MAAEPITNLNGGVEPASLDATDKIAVVDVSDTTQAPTGTTKPSSLSKLTTFFNSALTFLSSGDNVSELTNDSGYVTSNITHTGEVTGLGTLSMNSTAITNKTTVTGVSGDFVLISDTSDAGNLKKVDVVDFLGGGGGGTIYEDVCGIANSSGAVVFYSDLNTALSAALAGDTVQVFTDITETGAVTITLVDGVDINFNGHTYILDNAATIDAFTTPNTTGLVNLFNGKIKRINGVGTHSAISIATMTVVGNNFQIETIDGQGMSGTGVAHNFDVRNSGTGTAAAIAGGSMELHNCKGFSTTGSGISSTGTLYNCYGWSDALDGIEGSPNGGEFYDCTGISEGRVGILGGARLTRCNGWSNALTGLEGYGAGVKYFNCVGYSTVDFGIKLSSDGVVSGCTAYSVDSSGLQMVGGGNTEITNCTIISESTRACYINNSSLTATDKVMFSGNKVISKGGVLDAMRVADSGSNGGLFVTNNTFELTSAAANCLYANAPTSIYFTNNIFSKTSTTAVNANITNLQVNTEDSFGNIQLG